MEYSSLGSSLHGILQARTLEWKRGVIYFTFYYLNFFKKILGIFDVDHFLKSLLDCYNIASILCFAFCLQASGILALWSGINPHPLH